MSRERISLRREVLILLPVSQILLVALAVFTLLSYRSGLSLLLDERRNEAAREARNAAARLAVAHLASAPSGAFETELRRLGRESLGAALVDEQGQSLLVFGDLVGSRPLAPLAGRMPGGGVEVVGPESPGAEDRVIAFARLPGDGPARVLRLDLDGAPLARQLRAVRVLTAVVVGLGLAVLVLVLFFLRHLLRPYEQLLDQARRAGSLPSGDEDEVGFLVATFERAMQALAQQQSGPPDELSSLERTLGGSLDSGLLLLDREGGVLALNVAGAQLLGLAPPAPGTPFAQAFAALPAWREVLERVVATGETVKRLELQLDAATIGLTAHPLRREGGEVRGFLALFADLTAVRLEERERRLADSLAQLGEMAAGVAHELRNSLATMTGYLTLAERPASAVDHAESLAEIRREVERMKRVVGDFLSFARPGTARSEKVDLVALVRRAALDPGLGGARVRVSGDSEIPAVSGDVQLLERVVHNLLANAIQAERDAGRGVPEIEAELRRQDTELVLEIRDRGPGISPELRSRLFQPFVSGRADGVGLGLALAHRIVTLHGGKIEIENRSDGGARVVLRFPLAGNFE